MSYEAERTHRDFFNQEEQEKIVQAIEQAEEGTSGEIRIHIEDHSDYEPFLHARMLFEKLEMDQTKDRNGVLIYLAVKDHRFAIFGDQGLDEKVSAEFWRETIQSMRIAFSRRNYLEGMVGAIHSIGLQLRQHFPLTDEPDNELPNTLSFGGDSPAD